MPQARITPIYPHGRWRPILVLAGWMLILLTACGPANPEPVQPAASPESLQAATPLPAEPTVETQEAASPTPPQPTAPPTEAAPGSLAVQPTPTAAPTPAGPHLELALQTEGSLEGFDVAGSLAYLAAGLRLVVVDVSDPAQPQEVGRSEPLPGVAQAVVVSGDLAYLASFEGGLMIMDVSNPVAPRLAAVHPSPDETQALDVAGEQAAVIENRCFQSACTGSLRLLDLSDPAIPVELGAFELPDRGVRVTLDGTTAYVAHMSGVEVIDISDPAAPRSIGRVESQYLLDAAFQPPYAYLSADGLQTVDLTDPANPRLSAGWRPESGGMNLQPLAASDTRLFAFDTFGEFGYCDSSLFTLDLADRANPAQTRTQADATLRCAIQALVDQDRLYVADWNGLNIYNLPQDALQERLGLFPVHRGVSDLTVAGNHVFWGNGLADRSLHVTDLSDPQAIQTYGPFEPGWTTGGLISGQQLIVPVWQNGLQVLDISQPLEPHVTGMLGGEELLGTGLHTALNGSTLYLTMESQGVAVIDLSQPTQPRLVTIYPPTTGAGGQMIEDIALAGNTAYATGFDWNQDPPKASLQVLDVQDPAQPQLVGETALPEPNASGRIALSGSMAYVASTECSQDCQGSLHIFDLADPLQPQYVASLAGMGTVQDIATAGSFVLVAGGLDGVWLMDVSDPNQPVLLQQVNTPGNARGLQVVDDQVYLADDKGGILVFRLVQP